MIKIPKVDYDDTAWNQDALVIEDAREKLYRDQAEYYNEQISFLFMVMILMVAVIIVEKIYWLWYFRDRKNKKRSNNRKKAHNQHLDDYNQKQFSDPLDGFLAEQRRYHEMYLRKQKERR